MFVRNLLKAIAGDPNKKEIQKHSEVVAAINALEGQFRQLSADALRAKTDEFKARLADEIGDTEGLKPAEIKQLEQAALDDLLPEVFAVVREAAMRALGLRPYDVQLIGGIVLHQGKIAEMRTGEGKTLVATLPTYLNALLGRGVHVITVNDYLARRDAKWMGPLYALLGLSVGILQEAARTENGKKAFLYDPTVEAAHEDARHARLVDRREAYAADVTYGTNNEFGFDYLRDNMAMNLADRVQRIRYFAIVDEVDNILIDEARTPLIISGPSQEDSSLYTRIAQIARQLKAEDYEIDERSRSVALNEIGEAHLEKLLGQPLRDPDRPEELTPDQARILGHVEQAMRAEFLFKRNKDYLVENHQVVIVDEFTGRKMIGRRWSDGLHQAVEAKEGVPVQQDNVTYATITLQNYFRLYTKLAGMTGTALTEAEEFDRIYNLQVTAVPTNLEYQATRADSGLTEVEYKEDGQKFHYFARKDDPQRPVLWRRRDYPDVVYRTEEAKLRSAVLQVLKRHAVGQPLLIGTTSVELSEHVSERLRAEALQRLAQIYLIREKWFVQNNREEDGMVVPELKPLDVPLEKLSKPDLAKQMKDLGLSSNPFSPENIALLADILEVPESGQAKLTEVLQSGIKHNVLNAKKHDEESRIIAEAGALYAVTIATNMAGRGVDIKLGGELAEEILTAVNRVLKQAGHNDPYDLSNEARKTALLKIPEGEWGVYQQECQLFLQEMENAVKVKEVGGLHVIGSERHEARRIDNQLRGRAARQGDIGSSQFYLSLEDDLMRRFGGQQVSDLMQRLSIDDGVPVQAGLVNRIIEQSQTRVEGANFDTRKHLLEYDDVLNSQRNRIYDQRDRIFTKDDLTDDFQEMLIADVTRRVTAALAESEGRWKLFAWLDEAQPALPYGPASAELYPSYLLEVLVRELEDESEPRAALVELARSALETERKHILDMVEQQVEGAEERLGAQAKEKRGMAELALEGVENEADETGQPIDGRAAYRVVAEAIGLPSAQLTGNDLREFDFGKFKKQLPQLAEAAVVAKLRAGLIATIERRIGAALGMRGALSNDLTWDEVREQLLEAATKAHADRAERSLTEIDRELKSLPEKPTRSQLVATLINLAWGTGTGYDQKHRKVTFRTQRLNYFYLAGEMVEDWSGEELKQDILKHLRGALDIFSGLWGEAEWRRLGALKPDDFLPNFRTRLAEACGAEALASVTQLNELQGEAQTQAQVELGRQALTFIFRQLMLGVIGQLWVEYLTTMEALRTSIGLEAYGQRDPLAAYKGRASELFQQLLVNIRAETVARAFTYRPRAEAVTTRSGALGGDGATLPATAPASARNLGRNDACWCGSGKKYKDCHLEKDQAQSKPASPEPVAAETGASEGGKKKRRRR